MMGPFISVLHVPFILHVSCLGKGASYGIKIFFVKSQSGQCAYASNDNSTDKINQFFHDVFS